MKKLISMLLSLVMCVGLCVPAFAIAQTPDTIEPNVTVVNHSATISEQVLNEIAKDVSAILVHEDGTVTPVESVVTIENVISPSIRSSNTANTYQLRVDSKIATDSDTKNDEGVSASMSVTIRWTDFTWPEQNRLDSVAGSITIDEGKLSDSYYSYGGWSSGSSETVQTGTATSFYRSVIKYAQNPNCIYVAYFENAKWQLNVSVTPAILD